MAKLSFVPGGIVLAGGNGPVTMDQPLSRPARSDSQTRAAVPGGAARKVLAVGLLLVGVLVAATVGLALRRYNAELTDAARELRTIDLLLGEEASRSLQGVSLVLDNVADQVRGEGVETPEGLVAYAGTKAIHDALRARVAGVPQLDAVTVVAASGKLINFSRTWPVPDIDLRDRDYFVRLSAGPGEAPFLSEPVLNRGTGTPTVYLARRLEAPDGTFLGLLLGAIELGYFERFYASLHLDPGDFVALWRSDGVLLARFPPARLGQRLPVAAITSPEPLWHGVQGVFEKPWTIDNGVPERRVVASTAVPGFPVQVNIGRNKNLILADWRREVGIVGTVAGVAALCLGLFVWELLRRIHAYEALAVALRERESAIAARQQAEDALRQAQKMDAVGQLTGGVAHDFNNLLTVMRGSVDLLRRPHLSEDRRQRYVEAIADATGRASKLTAQLLAFARRQALKPEVFDAVENARATADLVARLAGSRIQVRPCLPDEPCWVEADPSQFDTSIINMAVNARDAMPDGGVLTIGVAQCAGIPAGRTHGPLAGAFVAVSVGDTGAGIAPDILDRVFEPFFTTKNVGEGTGLGLSQVFGFAKQSGGEVLVESSPGRGSTFTLYLPRASGESVRRRPKDVAAAAVPERGRRILLVEDDEQVAILTLQALTELGHDPTWAPSGEQALLDLDDEPGRFDLLLSDVMMPGISGVELGHRVRRRHPGLPIVLTSGYSDGFVQKGLKDFTLLAKPYALEDLARVLNEAAAPDGPGPAPVGLPGSTGR